MQIPYYGMVGSISKGMTIQFHLTLIPNWSHAPGINASLFVISLRSSRRRKLAHPSSEHRVAPLDGRQCGTILGELFLSVMTELQPDSNGCQLVFIHLN